MADQKLIGVIDLLRQSQDETKEEIVTTRHSIQVMNNEIVKNLKILAGNVETAEEREERMRLAAQKNGGAAAAPEKPKVEPEGGFLTFLLTALGLTGAALAGLAAGFAEAYIKTYTAIFKDFTKLVRGSFNLLLKPFTVFTDFIKKPFMEGGSIRKLFSEAIEKLKPQFIDDIVKAFGEGGRVRVLFTTAIDNLKPSFIDDIVKAFGEGGRVRVLFTTAIDNLKPQFIDDIIKAFKAEGKLGLIFTKINNFFGGDLSPFKRIGTLVDDAAKALAGFTPKVFPAIKNFFMGSDTFKNITTSFDEMKAALPDAKAVKTGFIGKMTGAVKSVFSSIKSVATSLFPEFSAISNVTGDVSKGGGLVKTILGDLLGPVKKFFTAFKSVAKFIAAPLIPIMAVLDAFFEGKDAAEKSEGTLATIVNSVVGAIGGLIDGAVFQLADLIKSGISLLVGALGFKEIEKTLDSFSFSEIFNKILDGIYEFVNKIFNNPMGVVDSVVGFFKDLVQKIKDFLNPAKKLEEVAGKAKETFDSLKEGADKLANDAVEGVGNFFNKGLKIISRGRLGDNDTYKGGIVVTKPTWLPNSGTVVGEHSTWQGKGAYSGGIPMDGPAEAIIPLGSDRAGVFIDPMARSIAGQIMNQMAMERVAMQTAGMGASSAPIVTDNSTQIVNNNTTTTITNPIGQMLPGESDDFVRKVA